MHVLSTPPAFTLSQDQTLHTMVYSEPEGSVVVSSTQACAWLLGARRLLTRLEPSGGKAACTTLSDGPLLLKHLPLSCFAELAFRCALGDLSLSDSVSLLARLELVKPSLISLECRTRRSIRYIQLSELSIPPGAGSLPVQAPRVRTSLTRAGQQR